MQPFGQACTAMYPKKEAPDNNIGEQAIKGIMVGYDDMDGTKTYRIYIPSLRKILVAPDVTFVDFKVTTGTIPDVTTLTDQLFNEKSTTDENKNKNKNKPHTQTNPSPDVNNQRNIQEQTNANNIINKHQSCTDKNIFTNEQQR